MNEPPDPGSYEKKVISNIYLSNSLVKPDYFDGPSVWFVKSFSPAFAVLTEPVKAGIFRVKSWGNLSNGSLPAALNLGSGSLPAAQPEPQPEASL